MRQTALRLSTSGISPLGSNQYVPILKAKMAELRALRWMDETAKGATRPLIELVRPASTPAGTAPEDYLEPLIRDLGDAWGRETSAFVDTIRLPLDTGEANLLELVAEIAADIGVSVIPISGPDRPPAHSAVASRIAEQMNSGLGVRVQVPVNVSIDRLAQELGDYVTRSAIDTSSSDLIIDFGSICDQPYLTISRSVRRVLTAIGGGLRWRSLITALGAFPTDLSGFKPCSSGTIERKDWQVWSMLPRSEPRIPSFGDYAISHPRLPTEAHRAPLGLRYASDKEWRIIKGRPPGEDDSWFSGACSRLVGSEYFSGEDFSQGDHELCNRVQKPTVGGNATTWRAIGTSHHIALVLSNLAPA